MTEERARYYAEKLALNLGITFYVVRSPEDEFTRCRCRPMTARSSRLSCRSPAYMINGQRKRGPGCGPVRSRRNG